MEETYRVKKSNEVLEARLVTQDGTDKVRLSYTNNTGNKTEFTIYNGLIRDANIHYANTAQKTPSPLGHKATKGLRDICETMGPELRSQLPQNWQNTLGFWLLSKEQKHDEMCRRRKGK